MLAKLLIVGLVAASAAAVVRAVGDGPATGPTTAPSADLVAMRGTWRPTAAELGGRPFPEEVRKAITLVIDGDAYTVTVGNDPDKGTVRLDPAAHPKALDVTGTDGPNKGRTFPAIYDLDGDTLQVCYDLSGQARPTEFKSAAGTQQFLVTYRRDRP